MNTPTVDYPSLFARLAAIDSTHLADADKTIAACAPELRPVRLGQKLIGRAFTLRLCEDFLTVIAALGEAEPGDVLVVDTQGSRRAVVGELFSLEAARKGLAGIVVDGLVRDTATIRTLAMPVYARGASPQAGTIKRLFETQVPVSCGGTIVRPGDILFGDDDGLLVASPAAVLAALPTAETIAAREAELIKRLQAGQPLASMVNAAEHLRKVRAGEPSALQFDI
jgi:RraA family protein